MKVIIFLEDLTLFLLTKLELFRKILFRFCSRRVCTFGLVPDWQIQAIFTVGFSNPTGAVLSLKTFLKLA